MNYMSIVVNPLVETTLSLIYRLIINLSSYVFGMIILIKRSKPFITLSLNLNTE